MRRVSTQRPLPRSPAMATVLGVDIVSAAHRDFLVDGLFRFILVREARDICARDADRAMTAVQRWRVRKMASLGDAYASMVSLLPEDIRADLESVRVTLLAELFRAT